MNIGIFGDSFADPVSKNTTPSWISILNQHFPKTVASYGVSSSNLYYSVEAFKKFHKKHNRNVFVVTAPGRLWARGSSFPIMYHKFFNGVNSVEDYIDFYKSAKEPERTEILKLLEAIRVYITYIQDFEYESYLQKLMIQDLLSIDKNIILIPCYNISNIPIDVNGNLFDIFEKENKAWGIDGIPSYKLDIRNCHMTAENNAILAQKVIDCLEKNQPLDLNINDFKAPTLDSKEFYIKGSTL